MFYFSRGLEYCQMFNSTVERLQTKIKDYIDSVRKKRGPKKKLPLKGLDLS